MTTYFGRCNSDGTTFSTDGAFFDGGEACWHTWTCPGSGSQSVTTTGVHGRSQDGFGTARGQMAIYNSAGTTLLLTTGVISTTTTQSWQSDTTTTTLTGGTSYIIAFYVRQDTTRFIETTTYEFFTAGTYRAGNSWDSGFPASLPTDGEPDSGGFAVRVGVDAAGGGSLPPGLASSPARRYYPQYVRSPRGILTMDRSLLLPKRPSKPILRLAA